MIHRRWFRNRVLWGMTIFFIVIGLWEFRWKPQYRPYYENGVAQYQKGAYMQALIEFQRAYEIVPNATDVLLMLGWTNLKLHRFEEARVYFDRTLKIDSRIEEAEIGASFVALETGRGTLDLKVISHILDERPDDANLHILAAAAVAQAGDNLKAAEIYRSLLKNASYGRAAEAALRDLYGLGGTMNPVPDALPPVQKPAQVQVKFRAADNSLWRSGNNGWEKFYLTGINFIPAAPGLNAATDPADMEFYSRWLKQAVILGVNTLQVNSLLPPAFYRAYLHDAGQMALLQQLWLDTPTDSNFFARDFYETATAEIREGVDALHGNGNVKRRGRRGAGLYAVDVSANVAGILLGADLDANIVIANNVKNPARTTYAGKYISISGASATEVWFAEMLDYLVKYEVDTYGWQHPVAISNTPKMDFMSHPTEALATGNDSATLDEAKLKVASAFTAGLFAAYTVRPYYPDFMLREPHYATASDSLGPNPVNAYIRDLRAHIPYPLVIKDFGMPTSIGVSHLQPGGWNQGGLTEQQQAEILIRVMRGAREAGCAGIGVFELIDEWYRPNWLTRDFESPLDRAALWMNDMSPDSRFGLVGFRTSKWRLFAGDAAAWNNERTLYRNSETANGGFDPARNLRSLQAAADEGFLYLRLKVDCVECAVSGIGSNLKAALQRPPFAISINTLPGEAGVQQLPFASPSLAQGANFLVYLGADSGKLLIASNYKPYQIAPKTGNPNETEFRLKHVFTPSLKPQGGFEEMVFESESEYGRNGILYPGQRYIRSDLRYGNGNPDADDFDSIAEWYADKKQGAILVRIPWGKLLVTDPSSLRAFYGFTQALDTRSKTTTGVQLTVFALQPGATYSNLGKAVVMASFPAAANGRIDNSERIMWVPWNSINPELYHKRAFTAIQKEFSEGTRAESGDRRKSERSTARSASGHAR